MKCFESICAHIVSFLQKRCKRFFGIGKSSAYERHSG